MGSFGENLRREREMRGVTLKEISDSTKISVRFLDALETEEFSRLPGGIFTRSFIRSYANYLGLDPEQVLAEFQLVVPPKNDEDFSRIGVSHTGSTTSGRRTAVAWLIAVILLAGGYLLFHYSHENTGALGNYGSVPQTAKAAPLNSQPNPSTTRLAADAGLSPATASPLKAGPENPAPPASRSSSTALVSSTGSAPGESPAAPPAPVTSDATARGTPTTASADDLGAAAPGTSAAPAGTSAEPPKVLGEGPMVLQIAATERSWVAVECDGKTLLQRVLNPNEVRTLRASDYFNVTTGNAQGITLTLNGQPLKPLGRYGEVKTVRLTLADLKRPAAHP